MTSHLGRGPFLSLRRRVNSELAGLRRRNADLRAARYPWPLRAFKVIVGDRSLGALLIAYLILDVALVAVHAAVVALRPALLRPPAGEDPGGALKDISSYLLGGQLTILGVVAVAVSVVTLLAQRTEGASARTEIRLYYVEAFAYELVTSGIALSMVLAIQLFWPLQALLKALLGLDGAALTSQVVLTGFHAAWLAGNLALFFQFMMTTLRFVEPSARAQLRERYSANAVIPQDLRRRLMTVLYVQLADPILGKAASETGPHLSVGYARRTFQDAVPEVTRTFRRPRRLVDVWERPLAWAVRGWAARVRRRVTPQPQPLIAGLAWTDRLAVCVHPGGEVEGPIDLVSRVGGVPFTPWERWLVRQSFRFAPARAPRHELPTPQDFMEELADQVIGQIDRAATTGFKAALAELVRFHRFLLAAQQHVDDEGEVFNFAQIGGLFQRPDQGWVGQYRRLYHAAANRIGEDPQFIDQLGYLAHRLIPDDPAASAPAAVADILDLGVYEVLALEAWVTRHTTIEVAPGGEAAPRLVLAGSDRRAYEEVVVKFVGAWETLLSRLEHRYHLDEARRGEPSASWIAHGRAWRFLETHLRGSAMMLAIAVWNEDVYGAERYRDLLLRWPERLEAGERQGRLRHRALLIPDWIGRPLEEVADFAAKLSRTPGGHGPPPDQLFSALWREAFNDAVVLCAAVALSWHVRGQHSTDLAAQTARGLLRREALDDGGRPLRGGSGLVFQNVIGLVVRTSFALRPSRGSYGEALDQLVRGMMGMSERHVVPGRVYTSWGPRGVESLHPELLAMLAAFAPATGDGGVGSLIDILAQDETLFANGDLSVQDAIYSLQRFADGLGSTLDRAAFQRAVLALSPDCDVEAARGRVAEVLTSAVETLREARRSRLAAEPLDLRKITRFGDVLQEQLQEKGLPLAPLQPGAVDTGPVTALTRHRILPGVDKGLFTTPPRSSLDMNDMVALAAEDLRDQVGLGVRHAQWQRPKRTVRLAARGYPGNFWRAVARRAAEIAAAPVLVVPHRPTGELVSGWVHGYGPPPPPGLTVERREDADVGEAAHYEGRVGGVDVYSADLPADRALLFSAKALRRLRLASQADDERWVGMISRANLDGQTVDLDFAYALECEWDDSPFFEFRIRGLDPAAGEEP